MSERCHYRKWLGAIHRRIGDNEGPLSGLLEGIDVTATRAVDQRSEYLFRR
jgi:hypothetical protein